MTVAKPVARAPAAPDAAERLLAVVRAAFRELRRETGAPDERVTLHSLLDRDLGFDSLARVELLLRIEKAFGVQLGEEVLGVAETPADLLQAVRKALPAGAEPAHAPPHAPGIARDAAAPESAATLVEVLEWHALRHPERVHIVHRGEHGDAPIRYGELWWRAQAFAAGLQARGLGPRQTVALMLPTSPDYFPAWLGALIAGGIPVPIYPPARPSQVEDHVRRHAGILANAQAALMVTVPEARGVARLLKAQVPTLGAIVTPAELAAAGGDGARVARAALRGEDIAFLQYTSGSTGNPKGVILTHANILANLRALGAFVRVGAQDVIVSWLPLYHDMGLISSWLTALYYGRPFVVMSPLAFLARPARWLWAIHDHRGTLSAAPNFAYELCLRIDERELDGLDLSSWRIAVNGSEQVQPDTLERFTQRFARHGLRPETLLPCYGLAESTVALLAPPPGRRPRIDCVRRDAFLREGVAAGAPATEPGVLRFASCGSPLPGHRARIVDRQGRELPPRMEGRLEFRGPSATQGYYRNPAQTQRLFHGEWLDSGDRAYHADGEFFITGRVKDIVIRGGHHLHPDEIERAVGAVPGVRKGCVAAFGSPNPATGTERLVVVAETRRSGPAELAALREAVTRATVEHIGEAPDEVVLARPRAVLKTSSGKLRRAATRERYERGQLGAPERAPWWQWVRLVAAAAGPELRRARRRARELAYAAWAWCAFALVGPPGWLATVLARSPDRAWIRMRAVARLLLRLARIRVVTRGLEHVPGDGASVLVCNHASYLDGLVLLAHLPRPYRFIAKKEFRGNFIARRYLEALGAEFVERFAIRESVADADRLLRAARSGHALAFFPEGTFRAAAGLQPFRLGAFLTAARAGVPVVAVALRGTRERLRADERVPHPGTVELTVAPPLAPPRDRDAFGAALQLRDAAHAAIAASCGEPDLQAAAG